MEPNTRQFRFLTKVVVWSVLGRDEMILHLEAQEQGSQEAHILKQQ